MPLNTHEQKLALKADIQANTTVLPFAGGNQQISTVFGQASLDAGDAAIIAAWYNLPTSPAFWGFPASVSVDKVYLAISPAEYLVLSGQAATTNLHHNGLELLLRNGSIRPQSPEVRTWITTLLPAGTTPLSRAAILAAVTRIMTNLEKVFKVTATGPAGGDGSAQNVAAVLAFEGSVNANDIQDVHGLPA